MNRKDIISTTSAPSAIGTYSQAVRVGDLVFISGQIPLVPAKNPEDMQLVSDDIVDQIQQAFENLSAITQAAGGSLDDIVKLTVFLTDLSHFPLVNEAMQGLFSEPFPARAALGVSELPKGAAVEVEAIMVPPGGGR